MKWYRRLRAKVFLCQAFRLPWSLSNRQVGVMVRYMLACRAIQDTDEWPADVEATVQTALTELT